MDSHFRTVILVQTEHEHHFAMHGQDNVVKYLILKSQLLSSEFYSICSFFLKPQCQLSAD